MIVSPEISESVESLLQIYFFFLNIHVTGIDFFRPGKRKILAGKSLIHSELQKVFVRKLNDYFKQFVDY